MNFNPVPMAALVARSRRFLGYWFWTMVAAAVVLVVTWLGMGSVVSALSLVMAGVTVVVVIGWLWCGALLMIRKKVLASIGRGVALRITAEGIIPNTAAVHDVLGWGEIDRVEVRRALFGGHPLVVRMKRVDDWYIHIETLDVSVETLATQIEAFSGNAVTVGR